MRRRRVETAGRMKLGMPVTQQTDDEFERVEERLTAEAKAPEIGDAFASLPEDQRAALELRAIDQLPYAEVAERLGCTENAARLRVSRALGAIRGELQGEET
jgi:RNA polymerase sigma-70 factor (ECF subfamily)